MSYIKINNLKFKYNNEKKYVLNDVNLEINKGEIVLIVGSVGSGKSSLLRAISKVIPDFYGGEMSGNILFNDRDLEGFSARESAEKIACVFQYPELQLIMDEVHREIAFSLENLNIPSDKIKRKVFEALNFLGLQSLAYRKVEELSGGEKQKVVLASCLAQGAETIILDDPTSQLDPKSSEDVISLIRKMNQELYKTIIVVEQNIDGWFDIADKIVFLDEGRVSYVKNKEEFYKDGEFDFLPYYLRIAKDIDFNHSNISFKAVRGFVDNALKKRLNISSELEDGEEVLNLSKLNAYYDKNQVLKDINLSFKKGRIYSIIGENGAGKSSLLRAIMNLIKYDGKVFLEGNNISKKKTYDIVKKIGYLSQNPNDYISKETVYEEIKFTCDNYNISDDDRINSILNKLELQKYKDKNPRDLSGGEKERLALATILITEPDILLLDEPTRGLDYKSKDKLGKMLLDLVKDSNKTVIIVTHDMNFVSEYCDETILMLNGEVISSGSMREVLREGIYYTSTAHKLSGHKEIVKKEELIGWLK